MERRNFIRLAGGVAWHGRTPVLGHSGRPRCGASGIRDSVDSNPGRIVDATGRDEVDAIEARVRAIKERRAS
jgi:hypothetical protein